MNAETYSGLQACAVAGCSYRQADYWCRNGTVVPSVPARGPGSQRLFDLEGVRSLRLAGLLSAHGSVTHARANGFVGEVIARAVTAASQANWAGYLSISDEGVGVSESAMDALDDGGGILVTIVNLAMVAAHVDGQLPLLGHLPVGA